MGGYQDFPSKFFFLAMPTTFAGEPSVLCFRMFSVAKNSMDNKGGYQDFPSKAFSSHCVKIFAREPFCVVFQKTSGSEKDYGIEGGYGVVKILRRKFSCLTVPNFSQRNPFVL